MKAKHFLLATSFVVGLCGGASALAGGQQFKAMTQCIVTTVASNRGITPPYYTDTGYASHFRAVVGGRIHYFPSKPYFLFIGKSAGRKGLFAVTSKMVYFGAFPKHLTKNSTSILILAKVPGISKTISEEYDNPVGIYGKEATNLHRQSRKFFRVFASVHRRIHGLIKKEVVRNPIIKLKMNDALNPDTSRLLRRVLRKSIEEANAPYYKNGTFHKYKFWKGKPAYSLHEWKHQVTFASHVWLSEFQNHCWSFKDPGIRHSFLAKRTNFENAFEAKVGYPLIGRNWSDASNAKASAAKVK